MSLACSVDPNSVKSSNKSDTTGSSILLSWAESEAMLVQGCCTEWSRRFPLQYTIRWIDSKSWKKWARWATIFFKNLVFPLLDEQVTKLMLHRGKTAYLTNWDEIGGGWIGKGSSWNESSGSECSKAIDVAALGGESKFCSAANEGLGSRNLFFLCWRRCDVIEWCDTRAQQEGDVDI